jgi:hypothetical protein
VAEKFYWRHQEQTADDIRCFYNVPDGISTPLPNIVAKQTKRQVKLQQTLPMATGI